MTKKRLLIVELGLAALFFCGCTAFIQRDVIKSGFDLVGVGMNTPGPTIMVIMNHWYEFLFSGRPWLDLNFFYPQTNTLGYSDTFFVFGLITAFLRVLGFDMFSAFQLFLIISPLIGFGFSFFLLRFQLKIQWPIAIICSLLIAYPLPFLQSWYFTQFCAIHFLPPILVSAYACAQCLAINDRMRACCYATLTGLQLGLLFYNSFYIPWFFVLSLLVAGSISLVIFHKSIMQLAKNTSFTISFGACCGGFTFAFAAAMIPFYLTYSTVLKTFGTHTKIEISDTLPNWYDFFNVGPRSLVWSSTYSSLFPLAPRRPMSYELEYGLTPFLLCSFFCGGVYLICLGKKMRSFNVIRNIGVVSFSCVLIYWLLMLRVGDFSLWTSTIFYIPGSSAIRAVFRANLLLYIPVSLVIAIAANFALNRTNYSFIKWCIFAILAFVLVAEQQVTPSLGFSASEQRKKIAQIGRPPPPCRAFLLTNVPRANGGSYYQRQAQVWSSALGIPTVNGYSSHFPPGYNIYSPDLPAYKSAMKDWIRETGSASRVCGLNTETLTFHPIDEFLF